MNMIKFYRYPKSVIININISFPQLPKYLTWKSFVSFCCGGVEHLADDDKFITSRGENHFNFLMQKKEKIFLDKETELPCWEKNLKKHYFYLKYPNNCCPNCGNYDYDYHPDNESEYDFLCDKCNCEFD